MSPAKNRKADQSFLQTLQSAELFSTLLDEDIHFITSKTEVRAFIEGENIFQAGDLARQFFMVMSGRIGIFRSEPGGRELCLAQFVAGEAFGDLDFVMQSSFNARAQALDDSALLLFPPTGVTLETLAQEAPGTIARLLMRALAMMSARLRSTNQLINEKTPWIEELRRQIYCDPSTGLWNKTFMDEEVPRFLVKPSAIIMMKPDRFKELNDSRGHGAGDEAMTKIAYLLTGVSETVPRAWAVRMKSNETALVVADCDEEGARNSIQLISKLLGEVVFAATDQAPEFRFTGSFSYALWPHDDPDWARLVKRTSEILLQAWNEGGQRVYRLKSLPSGGSL